MLVVQLSRIGCQALRNSANAAMITGHAVPSRVALRKTVLVQPIRAIRTQPKGTAGFGVREGEARSWKDRLLAPTTGLPITIGQTGVAAAAGLGIGALCVYGAGLGAEAGAIDRSIVWPQYVKDRIRTTYMYFGAGCLITAASAVACFRSPAMMRLVSRNSIGAIVLSMAAAMGSGILCQSIPYTPGLGTKQLAWMGHCAIMGALVAPLCILGGPLLTRAALYTAGIVGGLSTVAACAPSDKFLYMAGPLGIGLGIVFVSSIGSAFLAPTTALGAGLYSISMYGGLIVFSGFLLYDTQKIIRAAEHHPTYAMRLYDPVNMSIGIYLDTLNIFIRLAMILAGQNQGRRK